MQEGGLITVKAQVGTAELFFLVLDLWIKLIWARFLSHALSKLRLCSANHRPGYWSNLPCDWPSTAWAYSYSKRKKMGPGLTKVGPGPCITNVLATRRKNFSQWHRSFQRKLRSHWLKFLRHVAITLVIQGPGGLWWIVSSPNPSPTPNPPITHSTPTPHPPHPPPPDQ